MSAAAAPVRYRHLPANLQNQLASLPPTVRPNRGRRRLVASAAPEILRRHVLPAGAQQEPLAPDVFGANMNMPNLAANLAAAAAVQQGPPVPNFLAANLAAAGQQGPPVPVPVIVPLAQAVVAIRDLPAGYLPVIETQARCRKIDLKNMDVECLKCGALHWACERLSKSSIASPKFGTCCLDGKVKLPALQNPPRDLLKLYNGTNHHSKHFLTHITSYNNAFAMVSLSHNAVHLPGGPQSFIITGELKHMSGSLLPEPGKTPVYAQVYFQSNEEALDLRIQRANQIPDGNGAKRAVMQIIQDVLHRYNHYIALYKTARERIDEAGNVPDVHVRLHFAAGSDQRRYNLPTAEEVAIILPGDGEQPADYRDIIVQTRAGPLKRIMETNPAYQALYYVLLFPKGEHGWHRDIPLNAENGQVLHIADEDELRAPGVEPNDDDENPDGAVVGAQRRKRTNVTQLEYYAYRLHHRKNESDHLFRAQGLFQRYIVDAWAQTDQARLAWLKHNQDKLRVDIYKGIVDAVAAHADADLGELGQRFILPSSYIGSSRNMFQLYQDSLALARFFSKPDFFLTITANPNWEEITRELLPGQKPKDRPDLIARVFREKIRIILQKIKSGVLGKHVGHVYTIEFQKRGLPHVHILIFLAPESRIHEPAMLDKIISAQIPDPETHPRLHALVTKMMVHNPCGAANPTAPCMKNGNAQKVTLRNLWRRHHWPMMDMQYMQGLIMEEPLQLRMEKLLIILGLFHIALFLFYYWSVMPILNAAYQSRLLNTFTNMFTRGMIAPQWDLEKLKMK